MTAEDFYRKINRTKRGKVEDKGWARWLTAAALCKNKGTKKRGKK